MTSLGCTHNLNEMLAGAQVPALPQSAIRLLELARDPNNGPNEFAVPIETDPGLTGQVLRFVNSSYFGFSREVSSVSLAINLVGIRTIKNFALWSAVFSLMPNPRCGPFDLKSLWTDSLRRGLFSRALGRQLNCPEFEDLFAAALLQDMAIPLLAKSLPDQYARLLEARQSGKVRLSDLEQEEFGWTHAQAGAVIARGWKLPETIAEAIDTHVELSEQFETGKVPSAQVAVRLSAMLPATMDTQWVEGAEFVWAHQQISSDSDPDVRDVLQSVDEDFEHFAPTLKLKTPEVSLVESLELLNLKSDA